MKKLLALILAMVMVLSLAACGGEEDIEEYEEVEEVEEVEEAEDDMDAPVSDEHFADLQEVYAQLVELNDEVVALYNNDQIAADENINEALSQTAEILETVGNIDQSELNEADALELMESMGELAEALGMVVEGMQTNEEAAAADEMAAPVSNEHFADLQETYAQLTQLYDAVIELYNNDGIAADEDINVALTETEKIMKTVGSINQSELNEADALDLMEAMGELAEVLGAVVDSMQAA